MGKIESQFQGIATELNKSEDKVIQYDKNDWRRVRRIRLKFNIWRQKSQNKVILYINALDPPEHHIRPLPQLFQNQKDEGECFAPLQVGICWW